MSLGPPDLLVIVGVPLGAGALGVVFGVLIPRLRRHRQRSHGITLAAFADPALPVPPRPARNAATESPAVATSPSAAPESTFAPPKKREATGTVGADWADPSPATTAEPPRLRLEPPADRPITLSPTAEHRPPLRVHRPMDGTLQFLPGRLEIVEGREMGQEIRFVRQPGASQTEVTFGRQEGVAYRHVQLYEPTVSRLHARMTLEGTDWRLTNLSATNPAGVNGAALDAENGSIVLQDGDRIEMGEVVFRFRAK